MVRLALALLILATSVSPAAAICSTPSSGRLLWGFNWFQWYDGFPSSSSAQPIDDALCSELYCTHRTFPDPSRFARDAALIASVGGEVMRIMFVTKLHGYDMGRPPLRAIVRDPFVQQCSAKGVVATIAALKPYGIKVIPAPSLIFNWGHFDSNFGSVTDAQGLTSPKDTYGNAVASNGATCDELMNDGKQIVYSLFSSIQTELAAAGLADQVLYYDLSNEHAIDGLGDVCPAFKTEFVEMLLTDTNYGGRAIPKVPVPAGKLGISPLPVCDPDGTAIANVKAIQNATGRTFDWIDVHNYPDLDGFDWNGCDSRDFDGNIINPWVDAFPNACINAGEFGFDYCQIEGNESLEKQVHANLIADVAAAHARNNRVRAALAWDVWDGDWWKNEVTPPACTTGQQRFGKGYNRDLPRDAWGAFLDERVAADGPLGATNAMNMLPGGGDFESYVDWRWHGNESTELRRKTDYGFGAALGSAGLRGSGRTSSFNSICSPQFVMSGGTSAAVSAFVQTSSNTNTTVVVALNRVNPTSGNTIESKTQTLNVPAGKGWKQIQGLATTSTGAFLFTGIPSLSATYELCFVFAPAVAGQLARLDLDGVSVNSFTP